MVLKKGAKRHPDGCLSFSFYCLHVLWFASKINLLTSSYLLYLTRLFERQEPTRSECQAPGLVRPGFCRACLPDVRSHRLPRRQRLPDTQRGPERQLPGCSSLKEARSQSKVPYTFLVVVVDKAEMCDPSTDLSPHPSSFPLYLFLSFFHPLPWYSC